MTEKTSAEQTLAEQALPVGTKLCDGQFTITALLGAGGFGITYRAKDNVLSRTVVIKECFPQDFCIRQNKDVVSRNSSFDKQMRAIVRMFVREARSLAKLRHPNVVGVHRAFEENKTAYMALDLIDGVDLFKLIRPGATPLSPKRVKDILMQLLDAIEKVHEVDLLHRDISPDNVIIEKNGTPVLIDFGAARGDASRHTRAISAMLVVKDGYSPQEFYTAGSHQTPSSDLYALAATFYHVLSGEAPANSQARMVEIVGKKPDPCPPLVGRIEGYDEAFLQAIDTAMNINADDRLQSAGKWRSLIADSVVGHTSPTAARPTGGEFSLELEQTLSKLVTETNDEVKKSKLIPVVPKEVVPAPTPDKKTNLEWIEEFNQESLTAVDTVETEDVPFDDGIIEDPTPEPTSEKPRSDTDWIGRAAEKQERIRIELEAELDLFDDAQPGQKVAIPDPQIDMAEDLPDAAAIEDAAPKPKNLPLRLFVGVIVCFSVAAFVQGL